MMFLLLAAFLSSHLSEPVNGAPHEAACVDD
jgi:hypothetical protein